MVYLEVDAFEILCHFSLLDVSSIYSSHHKHAMPFQQNGFNYGGILWACVIGIDRAYATANSLMHKHIYFIEIKWLSLL